jgi:uncharacterized membrane protein
MKRLFYLDALRGIAILLMVVDHAYNWWLDEAGHATYLAIFTKFLGMLAAPIFLFLVGIGLAMSVSRAKQNGKDCKSISAHSPGLSVKHFGLLCAW